MAGSAGQPFGIADHHERPPSRTVGRILLALLVGLPVLAALLGFLGGGPARKTTAEAAAATLSVEVQPILRSGNWFETQIEAVPNADIADLSVAVSEGLWRRMSIDTLAPDAEKAEFKEGSFRYSFGPIKSGERFLFKLDGQIQSWGFRRLGGEVTLLDGDRPLASVPVSLTVLP